MGFICRDDTCNGSLLYISCLVKPVNGKKMNRKILTFILTITFLLFLDNPSIAVIDDYQDAVDAYNIEDYKTSYQLMLPLAKKGFAQAQYNLGVMYEKGNGVKQNHRKAKKWFSLAADQDLAKAVEKLD